MKRQLLPLPQAIAGHPLNCERDIFLAVERTGSLSFLAPSTAVAVRAGPGPRPRGERCGAALVPTLTVIYCGFTYAAGIPGVCVTFHPTHRRSRIHHGSTVRVRPCGGTPVGLKADLSMGGLPGQCHPFGLSFPFPFYSAPAGGKSA
ncbi:hypothetical protein AAFF_G00024090 [Aldrovandia affinis]|uniref:Uncharacterized protein n=1 Tax=Aldrovandia affinis TaxID=143900 RepID=A0AAD7T5T8_9TELE|nr:hypothetical protein AAFF_G00024090 [Aldrovandia affinis]